MAVERELVKREMNSKRVLWQQELGKYDSNVLYADLLSKLVPVEEWRQPIFENKEELIDSKFKFNFSLRDNSGIMIGNVTIYNASIDGVEGVYKYLRENEESFNTSSVKERINAITKNLAGEKADVKINLLRSLQGESGIRVDDGVVSFFQERK